MGVEDSSDLLNIFLATRRHTSLASTRGRIYSFTGEAPKIFGTYTNMLFHTLQCDANDCTRPFSSSMRPSRHDSINHKNGNFNTRTIDTAVL
jgi:hypothetical protein